MPVIIVETFLRWTRAQMAMFGFAAFMIKSKYKPNKGVVTRNTMHIAIIMLYKKGDATLNLWGKCREGLLYDNEKM